MATFDQLPAEQKAIIELVVQRGRSYQALADALQISPARVRELARGALVELSPRTAARVDDDWRGQVADYLLGQQSGPESTATKGHLKRSESARSWAFSVLDSLDTLYGEAERPHVPDGTDEGDAPPPRRERKREAAAAKPAAVAKPERDERDRDEPKREKRRDRDDEDREKPKRDRGPLSPAARDAVRRRRLLGGLATLLVVGAVVGALLLLTGGDDDEKPQQANTTQTTGGQARVLGQLALGPVGKAKAEGVAVIAQRGNTPQLIMQAQLPASQRRQAYEVWLYNSPTDAVSLGASTANKQGAFQGQGQLPANWRRYKFVDVSLETIDSNLKHSGNSLLRGAIADLQAPQQGAGTAPPGGAGATPGAPPAAPGGTPTTPAP